MSSQFQHHRVTIQAQQHAVRSDPSDDSPAMASPADSSIDDSQPWFELEILNDLPDQYRLMDGRGGLSTGSLISHELFRMAAGQQE